MNTLALQEFHREHQAQFTEVNGMEIVQHYGDALAEYWTLRQSAGILDLSFRGRLFLTGADRQRFLHGQATNDVNALKAGEGCYAAVVSAKGRIQSDANIYVLPEELLLDFEPGLTGALIQRFEKYIIADDVQVLDVAAQYGMVSVQGPLAEKVVRATGLEITLPAKLFEVSLSGGIICASNARGVAATGFDFFVPATQFLNLFERLVQSATKTGGRVCGFQALEMVRMEAGIPRFGVDMDESNLAPEAGIEERAISYSKGCYIGQEVIARIRTYGQVAKSLRGLRLLHDLPELPKKGKKLYYQDKEAGYITSAIASPGLKANVALGYVRKEHNQTGTILTVRSPSEESPVKIVPLPFRPEDLRK